MKSLKEVFEKMAKEIEKNPGITGFIVSRINGQYKFEVKGEEALSEKKNRDPVIIVEGSMDAIKLWGHSVRSPMAIL